MNDYVPLLLLFFIAAFLTGTILLLSHLLSPRRRLTAEKSSSYECGLSPLGTPRHRFSVKFYVVAMLFILFDVEVVFLYPWAILFREFVQTGWGTFALIEMGIFLGLLTVGLFYVYGTRALEWD